jgi:hypothetical protein
MTSRDLSITRGSNDSEERGVMKPGALFCGEGSDLVAGRSFPEVKSLTNWITDCSSREG